MCSNQQPFWHIHFSYEVGVSAFEEKKQPHTVATHQELYFAQHSNETLWNKNFLNKYQEHNVPTNAFKRKTLKHDATNKI